MKGEAILTLAAALVACGPALAQSGVDALRGHPHKAAVLRVLDKVTAKVSTFTVPVDGAIRFGGLNVRVRACFKRPPEEAPESTAFLEIADDKAKRWFIGWMYASSPVLTGLRHPVYDVWVVDCSNDSKN